MIFSDNSFVVLLPIFVAVYYLLPGDRTQGVLLVAASFLFLLTFGAIHALFALAVAILVPLTAFATERLGSSSKLPVVIALLSVLLLVKSPLLFAQGSNPIGASYYIFVLLSIIWFIPGGIGLRKTVRTIFFFPHLIAGPISRGRVLFPQLDGRRRMRLTSIVLGTQMVALGYAKKVLIADPISMSIAPIWSNPDQFSSSALWLAMFGFYIQLYADFSGYTDMARGVGRLLGYRLPINFRAPYLAPTPMEFWRRWHVSLSTWIRLYLYTPISMLVWRRVRSRRAIGPATLAIAIAVMVIVGLWHELSLRFLVFGVIHGSFIGLWYMVLGEKGKLSGIRFFVSALLFQFLLMLTLILFRSDNWENMGSILVRSFQGAAGEGAWSVVPGLLAATCVVFALQWVELRATRRDMARLLWRVRHGSPVFPVAIVFMAFAMFFKGMTIEGVWVSPGDPYFFRAGLQFIYAQF
jgi:alginate O-acetyltransferase complex protein AlgI